MIPMGSVAERHSAKDQEGYRLLQEAYQQSPLNVFEKLEAFPRFASKRSMVRFLCKQALFQKILGINGVIIECGVFNGAGLFSWAQFSNIYEPTNYNRKIIGFDTFAGFPNVAAQDANNILQPAVGDLRGEAKANLELSVQKYNAERHLAHIPNVELVAGDFGVTGPAYLAHHQHLLVSLLYLDFDLYEPTKKALELFLPRMGKGAIVCFDELNCANFPGETLAMLESFDIRQTRIERFPIDPWISYVVL